MGCRRQGAMGCNFIDGWSRQGAMGWSRQWSCQRSLGAAFAYGIFRPIWEHREVIFHLSISRPISNTVQKIDLPILWLAINSNDGQDMDCLLKLIAVTLYCV